MKTFVMAPGRPWKELLPGMPIEIKEMVMKKLFAETINTGN